MVSLMGLVDLGSQSILQIPLRENFCVSHPASLRIIQTTDTNRRETVE